MENLVLFHVGGNISLVAHKITDYFTPRLLMPTRKSPLTEMQSTSAPASVYCTRQALTGLAANTQGCPLSPQYVSASPPPVPSQSRGKETAGEAGGWMAGWSCWSTVGCNSSVG